MEVVIRRGEREDMPHVLRLIQELARHENFPNEPKLTVADLERDGFDSEHTFFFCILAEDTTNNTIIGHVIFNFAYSAWIGRAMYLEEFYVKPESRGKKIGHKLFKEICKVAKENDCHQIDFHTLVNDNESTIKFYKSHGAVDVCKDEERTLYRLFKDKINVLANTID